MTTTRPPLGRRTKIGLGIALALGIGDLSGPLGVPAFWFFYHVVVDWHPDTIGPAFMTFGLTSMSIAVVTVVGCVYSLRTRNRVGVRIVAGARLISLLCAVPVFLLAEVPEIVVIIATTVVVTTVAMLVLLLPRPTRPAPVTQDAQAS